MKDFFKTIISDKPILISVCVLAVISLICAIYFLIALNPSDLQVSIKYTEFGAEHVYSAHWTYMLSFAGFCIMLSTIHMAILYKLYKMKGRRFALFFGWCSVFLVIAAFAMLYRIINIAGRN